MTKKKEGNTLIEKHLRLTPEMASTIEAYAEKYNISESEIMRRAMGQGFNEDWSGVITRGGDRYNTPAGDDSDTDAIINET
jgi:hypothetical protein